VGQFESATGYCGRGSPYGPCSVRFAKPIAGWVAAGAGAVREADRRVHFGLQALARRSASRTPSLWLGGSGNPRMTIACARLLVARLVGSVAVPGSFVQFTRFRARMDAGPCRPRTGNCRSAPRRPANQHGPVRPRHDRVTRGSNLTQWRRHSVHAQLPAGAAVVADVEPRRLRAA